MGKDIAPGPQERRFAAYIEGLAEAAGHVDRNVPLKSYCTALLLPGERKSVEPMAARLNDGIHGLALRRCPTLLGRDRNPLPALRRESTSCGFLRPRWRLFAATRAFTTPNRVRETDGAPRGHLVAMPHPFAVSGEFRRHRRLSLDLPASLETQSWRPREVFRPVSSRDI